jgi:hypothetical protein
MAHRLRAVAFDLDAPSLVSLREALPEWEIEEMEGASATSLSHAWDPGAADLLVVMACEEAAETLGLCRFLIACGVFSTDAREMRAEALALHGRRRNHARRENAPLLVLLPSGQEALMRAALEAGADSCLVLPIHPKDVASAVGVP